MVVDRGDGVCYLYDLMSDRESCHLFLALQRFFSLLLRMNLRCLFRLGGTRKAATCLETFTPKCSRILVSSLFALDCGLRVKPLSCVQTTVNLNQIQRCYPQPRS